MENEKKRKTPNEIRVWNSNRCSFNETTQRAVVTSSNHKNKIRERFKKGNKNENTAEHYGFTDGKTNTPKSASFCFFFTICSKYQQQKKRKKNVNNANWMGKIREKSQQTEIVKCICWNQISRAFLYKKQSK